MRTPELGAGAPEERIERLAQLILAGTSSRVSLAGVGIGASGPVELPAGMITNADTLPWFSGFDLRTGLAHRLRVPVTVDNDAAAAAIGEHQLGAGAGARRLLILTLGTGVGAALVVEGRPWRGSDGQHLEVGHVPLVPGGARCYCGRLGCLETVASRRHLEAELAAAAAGEGVLGEDGDAIFARYGDLLGRALDLLTVVYGPDCIVLSGSGAAYLSRFRGAMEAAFTAVGAFCRHVPVLSGELGDFAGAIGASFFSQGTT